MSTYKLYTADNLELMKKLIKQGEAADLIYIDPPFNSKRDYYMTSGEKAFSDTWSKVTYESELKELETLNPKVHSFLKHLEDTGVQKSMISYLTAMSLRVYYMRELLKDTGSLYYHCDDSASHYVKIMLDYMFGVNNFRNEIVWCYNKWTNAATYFQKNHDVLFMYSKQSDYTFNKQYKITEYQKKAQKKGYASNNIKGKKQIIIFDKSKVSQTVIDRYDIVTYKPDIKGTALSDNWDDINIIASTAKERLGYPTQKPEALLERIIKASSNPGDLVMDFYNGGGTTGAVCSKLDRNYLGCDINYRAIQITKNRLEDLGSVLKKDLVIYGIPATAKELKQMVKDNILGTNKNSRFDLEEVTTRYYLDNVIGNDVKVGDNSIDGTFGFEYNGQKLKGLIQVTSGSNKNHLKSFCSEIGKGTGDLGVYICFEEDVTSGFIREVKGYGKLGNVDKIQILTFEQLIDQGKQYDLPV